MTVSRENHLWQRSDFEINTDPARLQKNWILEQLGKTYWAANSPREQVWRSIEGSIPFGLYAKSGDQLGFARVVTDGARFAWISDVIVAQEARGKGLGVWLLECCLAHPDLKSVGQWLLATDDAFDFYEKVGFERVPAGSKYMYRLVNRHVSAED